MTGVWTRCSNCWSLETFPVGMTTCVTDRSDPSRNFGRRDIAPVSLMALFLFFMLPWNPRRLRPR